MSNVYWTACQTIVGREREVRAEIEKANHGAFLPTYKRQHIRRGRHVDTERPLLPGYVIFQAPKDDWGAVNKDTIKGVIRVLAQPNGEEAQTARPITGPEMHRLMMGQITGMHDVFDLVRSTQGGRKRCRKPRPSKRARAKRKHVMHIAATV